MSRVGVIVLLVVTAALLQTALFPHLAIAGFRPDLLLLITVAFALRDGPLTGIVVGFGAGLVHDLMLTEAPVGIYAFILVAAGYTVGILRPYLPPNAIVSPLAVAFGSGVAATALYAVLARLLGDPRFTFELVLEAALLVALYNTLLAPPLFAATRALSERFPTRAAAVT